MAREETTKTYPKGTEVVVAQDKRGRVVVRVRLPVPIDSQSQKPDTERRNIHGKA